MKVTNQGDSFSNVFIYVADALRLDEVPDGLDRYGTVLRTISSGLQTPEAFGSIITGRYPPQHGVHGFNDILGEHIPTVFDLTDGTSPFYAAPMPYVEGTDEVSYHNDHDEWITKLERLDEPFVAMDRDLYPHAPYTQEWEGAGEYDTVKEYCQEVKTNHSKIVRDYRDSVETMFARFEEKVEILRERGILEDTLVVFTADHGELLGEHGLLGHGRITSPEQVYVPTVFCNDSITAQGDMMAHVDLLPTIARLMGKSVDGYPHLAGEDLVDGAADDRPIFNLHTVSGDEWSVWGRDGGHVFFDHGPLYPFKDWVKEMAGWYGPHNRRNPVVVLDTLVNPERTFGTPPLSREKASEFAEDVLSEEVQRMQQEISDGAMERLEALGYTEDDFQ